MKKLILFAALVALVGGTAFAQTDMGNSATPGATYATGVVVSMNSTNLTIRDDADQLVAILIVPATVGAKNHAVGSRVRVNFHHDDNDNSIADEIQGVSGDAAPKVAVTATAAPTRTYAPAPEPTQAPIVTKEPAYIPEPKTETTPYVEPSLPRTASPLAAIGLLGLLSLGAALVVRSTR